MPCRRGKFKPLGRARPAAPRCGAGCVRGGPRPGRRAPRQAVPAPHGLSREWLSSPDHARSGEPGRAARPSVPPGRGASTHLRSEVEEQGDTADHLAQPQPQQSQEHGARGGGGLVRRGRRRGVRGALVRGAGPAAVHVLGAAQVLGAVSAGAAHGARRARLRLGRSPAALPAARGSAEPARGQAGRDVGRAGRRAARAAAPTLINPSRRAGPASQSARRGRRPHSHRGRPFLPRALPRLSPRLRAAPPRPRALAGGRCGPVQRTRTPPAHPRLSPRRPKRRAGEAQRPVLVADKGDLADVLAQFALPSLSFPHTR